MAKKTAYGTSTGRQYLPAGAKRNPLTGTTLKGKSVSYYLKAGTEESGRGPVRWGRENLWGKWSGGTFTYAGVKQDEATQWQPFSFTLKKLEAEKVVEATTTTEATTEATTTAEETTTTAEAVVTEAEEKVNTQVTTLQSQLATAVAAIKNLQTSYNTKPTVTAPRWPGAPDWVQTFDDYRKWMRSKSAVSGYISTIKTGSSGLLTDDYQKNVNVTALTAG